MTQAESVQSLVSARTTEAAETALESLKGGLGSTLKGTKAEVDDLISELDARVDFDDELPPLDPDNIVERVRPRAITSDEDRLLDEKRMNGIFVPPSICAGEETGRGAGGRAQDS